MKREISYWILKTAAFFPYCNVAVSGIPLQESVTILTLFSASDSILSITASTFVTSLLGFWALISATVAPNRLREFLLEVLKAREAAEDIVRAV